MIRKLLVALRGFYLGDLRGYLRDLRGFCFETFVASAS
jgi:hypothetical protein